MGEKREHKHCPELCGFMDEVKDMVDAGGQEEIPKFRTPFKSYVCAALGIAGIVGFVTVMLYIWAQVL
jgi:hypothetical protein